MQKTFCALLILGILAWGCSPYDREQAQDSLDRQVDSARDRVQQGFSSGRIKSALLIRRGLDASNINVDTVGSTIYLRGSVVSQAQRTLARQLTVDLLDKRGKVVDELRIVALPESPRPRR